MSGNYIDRKKLAQQVILKRRELNLTQKDLGARTGVRPNVISLIESGRLGFRSPDHIKFVKAVAGMLSIEIPYLKDGNSDDRITVSSFEELKSALEKRDKQEQKEEVAPPSEEAGVKKKVDPELVTMLECGRKLEKLEDIRGRSRVINWLEDKYVTEPLAKSEKLEDSSS